MAENQEINNNEVEELKPDKKKKKSTTSILVGIICIVMCILLIGYFWHKQNQKPPVSVDVGSAVATVDVDRLMKQHSDYAKLEKLQAEKFLILSKLKIYTLDENLLKPPTVNPAPDVFVQVVDEQDNLRQIKTRQQLKEESIIKENEIRQNLAKEKDLAIEKINNKYTNAILNCTIKLDNAQNLKLTQEEIDNLLAILKQLKNERGNMVDNIKQQYNIRVANELLTWRQQREAELGLNNQKDHQIDIQDSLAKQQAEQQRDNQYLKDRMQMLKARKQDSARLIVLLHTKDNEINLLRKSILKDISSKATKVAIQKHLKLVIADTPMDMDLFGNIKINNFDNNILSGMVVGVDAIDITDDVINELTSKPNN